MIFIIEQTKTGFNLEYIAKLQNGTTLCNITSPFQTDGLNLHLEFPDLIYRMYFNNRDTTHGISMKERFKYRIFADDILVGEITGIVKKAKGLFQTYYGMKLELEDEMYVMYEVGFGRKGLYLCIYKNDDELIAIVEKDIKTVNFKDKYTVYTLGGEHVKYIIMSVLQYDIAQYGDIAEKAITSIKTDSINTIQKELIAKYDPEFIPRIKAMHEN